MKIAVVGTRGVPATFGGIEKHCEEVYARMVQMGHNVTIYARRGYIDENIREYKGINIIPLWTFKSKHLEATFHTFWALLHIIFSDADIIHFHAQGPCLFSWLPRILSPKKKIVFTCHGLDWQRNKWNTLAKRIIQTGEVFSAAFTDTRVMVSKSLSEYYNQKYGVNSYTITNGTGIEDPKPASIIREKFGLNGKDYLLFIGRLVPEKAPHKLIKSFKQVNTDKKLVIVGGSSATDKYESYLRDLAKDDPRIVFTSFLYNDTLAEIYSNAYLYVSTSELEGLPLTLLEAMSYGIPALVSSIPPHIEVIGKNEKYGYLFNSDKLSTIAGKIQMILDKPESELLDKRIKAKEKIKQDHSWNNVAKKLELTYNLTLVQDRTNNLKSIFQKLQRE